MWAGIKNIFIDSINWLIDVANSVIKYIPGVSYISKVARAKADASWAADHPTGEAPIDDSPEQFQVDGTEDTNTQNPIADNLGGIGGSADSSDRIKNINITIDSLVGNLTIETTNMHESAERIKDMITEALLGAVNDVNLAM